MGCLITKDDPPNPNVKPQPDKKEDNAAPNDDNKVDDGVDVAIRKEIREMSEQELDRFWKAINKMCENTNGPGTSEYFRIASYHGVCLNESNILAECLLKIPSNIIICVYG